MRSLEQMWHDTEVDQAVDRAVTAETERQIATYRATNPGKRASWLPPWSSCRDRDEAAARKLAGFSEKGGSFSLDAHRKELAKIGPVVLEHALGTLHDDGTTEVLLYSPAGKVEAALERMNEAFAAREAREITGEYFKAEMFAMRQIIERNGKKVAKKDGVFVAV